MRPSQTVLLYHFFRPDDVISARLFSDLAEGLQRGGDEVTAMPAIRGCFDDRASYPLRERWAGGLIRRVWRPAWPQKRNRGRMLNSLWMLAVWSMRAATAPRRVTVIVGSDPVMGVLAAIPWRLLRRRAKIIHWCHDVYPAAAVAGDVLRGDGLTARAIQWALRRAYRRCDAVVDLGPCMRETIRAAIEPAVADRPAGKTVPAPSEVVPGDLIGRFEGGQVRYATIPPWALAESPEPLPTTPEVRGELFGDAKLGLLYSGNLGRAHLFEPFLELAARTVGDSMQFCFAGRGARLPELQRHLAEGPANVSTAGFADEHQLRQRLAAADVHMVSLRPEWTGSVLPSKFFGSLAIGRPVLFAGSADCSLAEWIRRFDVSWVLNGSVEEVARSLREFAENQATRVEMNRRCWEVYTRHFSREIQLQRWRRLIDSIG